MCKCQLIFLESDVTGRRQFTQMNRLLSEEFCRLVVMHAKAFETEVIVLFVTS
jgi:hypothetical protein